jgi:hypothetical protein
LAVQDYPDAQLKDAKFSNFAAQEMSQTTCYKLVAFDADFVIGPPDLSWNKIELFSTSIPLAPTASAKIDLHLSESHQIAD